VHRFIPVEPIDLRGTLGPLCRGTGDPTMRVDRDGVWRTLRTPSGPATQRLGSVADGVEVEAWGAGAEWALDHAAALVGGQDDASALVPKHAAIAELRKHHRGRRLTRTGTIVPVLVAAILEQKVTGIEARRAWRRLVRATSEPAPGPRPDLLLPPDPARVAALGAFAFHPFGVEERRAMTVKRVCARAVKIERLVDRPLDDARRELGAIPGIGPWTVAEVARLALGDPDAVSIGDYHLPHLVAWVLAREPRATDERMLELLEPYRGQRGRVQLLLEAGHVSAPRFGPKREPAAIERL